VISCITGNSLIQKTSRNNVEKRTYNKRFGRNGFFTLGQSANKEQFRVSQEDEINSVDNLSWK